jgi:hypothetical protein
LTVSTTINKDTPPIHFRSNALSTLAEPTNGETGLTSNLQP